MAFSTRGDVDVRLPYRSWADMARDLGNRDRLVNLIAAFGRDLDGSWGLHAARELDNRRLAQAAATDIVEAYADIDDPRHHEAVAFMEGLPRFTGEGWAFIGADQGFRDFAP